MTAPDPQSTEDVLAAHEVIWESDGDYGELQWLECDCGDWEGERILGHAVTALNAHRAHVAAAIREAQGAECEHRHGLSPSGKQRELTLPQSDLEARVRALADEWESTEEDDDNFSTYEAAAELRALLDPPSATPPPRLSSSACQACVDCYHPAFGPNTDGDPCDWCQDCGCVEADHTPPPSATESERQCGTYPTQHRTGDLPDHCPGCTQAIGADR